MRMWREEDEDERLKFARRAAKCFEEGPEIRTFTESGSIEMGDLFAVRWGMDANCVVVFKVSDYEEPVNYQEIISNKLAREYSLLTKTGPKLLDALKTAKAIIDMDMPFNYASDKLKIQKAIDEAEGR